LGGGTTASGLSPAYKFTDIGYYTVTLTVTDEAGDSATVSMDITIVEPRHFEKATLNDIEDHGTIASDINVERTIDTNVVDVNVNITNEHRGNIDLTLVSPDGTEYVLKKHKREDNAQDIDTTYTVDFSGTPVGNWTLVIKDHYWNEVGQLNSGSLQF
jgi:subtilisin-like proprotein convertase family protein